MKFLAFFIFAFVALAASEGFGSNFIRDEKTVTNGLGDLAEDNVEELFSDDDDLGVDVDFDDPDDDTVIEGIPLKLLTHEEIDELLDEVNEKFIADLDFMVTKRLVEARQSNGLWKLKINRHKRSRSSSRSRSRSRSLSPTSGLFRGTRTGRLTRSGTRVTQQFRRAGDYSTAQRDFDRFGITNARSQTTAAGLRLSTGTIGDLRLTIRDGSSYGTPTFEMRQRTESGEYVRKIRYEPTLSDSE